MIVVIVVVVAVEKVVSFFFPSSFRKAFFLSDPAFPFAFPLPPFPALGGSLVLLASSQPSCLPGSSPQRSLLTCMAAVVAVVEVVAVVVIIGTVML